MEFTFDERQIAGLVLGYLKENDFLLTAEEFLSECSFFKERSRNPKMIKKYTFTRHYYDGTRLVDFLLEYAVIYTMVASHLESVGTVHEALTKSTLVQKLIYLLDKELPVTTSTPELREIDTTPSSSLPGNTIDSEGISLSKTPKRRTRSRSKEASMIDDIRDVSDIFTRSFLEKTELHGRIAETINSMRSGPDTARVEVPLESTISSGAAKELEALVKTVAQVTEEDPMYNEVINEIIGSSEKQNDQHQAPLAESSGTESGKDNEGIIADHNNEAVRSIMEVTQTSSCKPVENTEGGVYVFDGTLDNYLKTGAASSVPTIPSNQLYINTGGGVLVMPEATSQPFYILNNQPLLNVAAVPTVSVPNRITGNDIMAMDTVIINDDPKIVNQQKSLRKIAAKKVTVSNNTTVEKKKAHSSPHVRNLDFSNLGKDEVEVVCNDDKQKQKKSWDSELRALTSNCVDKSPTPKRKKNASVRRKKKNSTDENGETLTEIEVPKTPGLEETGKIFNTPFTLAFEEHLNEVDIESVKTPQIQFTPGFGLTPGDATGCNKRGTDYSTSSSYYQPPSDTEQNHSIEQLIEECNKMDEEKRVAAPSNDIDKKEDNLKTKFNKTVIGKKNLSLLNRQPATSSSSDSDEDQNLEELSHKLNKKSRESKINAILQTVDVKNTLEDNSKSDKIKLLSHLEQVRQRTVDRINNLPERRTRGKPGRKPAQPKTQNIKKHLPKTPKVNKKTPIVKKKKKEEEKEEKSKESDEADKLVKGLAQRGIHLVPNKTPQKKEEIVEEFNRQSDHAFEIVKYDQDNARQHDFKLEYLEKRFRVEVSLEEAKQDVVRIIGTTNFVELMEFPTQISTTPETPIDDELMDLALGVPKAGSESPGKIPSKSGRKRKSRLSEDEKRQPEKKSKTHESNMKLLKRIDVDDFLDKVHSA